MFAAQFGNVFLNVSNSQAETVRRANMITESAVALAAYAVNSRGASVSILRGQDYQINVALRDNSIPTAINLSSNTIAENLAAGSLVANLSASDANPVDQHQFELVAGSGDSDNGLFEVVGGQLRTRQVFDYESRPSFSVRLRVTDATGNAFETSKAISVINLPEVVAVQIGDGTAQRSSVDRVVIELEGQLEIDAGAFSVQKRERDSQGQLVLLTVTTVSTISVLPNGNTSVTLTFDGSYARWRSRCLGRWQLSIDHRCHESSCGCYAKHTWMGIAMESVVATTV